MSHTNSTANLSLPQFIGTDKPTWLSDVNGAFAAIDSYAGSNDAALAITDGKADTAIADASNAVTTAGNAATTAGNAAATATAANTVAGNALTVANGINSKVGVLTDLTTTDKSSVVNAINEVNAAVGTVPTAAQVTYDNTGSGLTASNVQDAIDEVAQGGAGIGAWQLAGQETGSTPISEPATYDEVLFIIDINNNHRIIETISVPKLNLTAGNIYRTGSYEGGSANSAAYVKYDNNEFTLINAYAGGSDVVNNSDFYVYYR